MRNVLLVYLDIVIYSATILPPSALEVRLSLFPEEYDD